MLKPCPFCGGDAEFERLGTGRQSCIVACGNCGARHESSDEYERSGSSWNQRAAPEGPAPTDPLDDAPVHASYKRMFEAAVVSLAEIDRLLGVEPDGCNDPETTVSALKDYIAGTTDAINARNEFVDAQYAAPEAPPPVEARQPQTGEPWDSIKYLLDSYPGAVRCRYKGLDEDLLASLSVTFIGLRDAAPRAALAAPAGARADPDVDWPCAKLVVSGHGAACDGPPTIVATFYAPGLPDGEHDVWCLPVASSAGAIQPHLDHQVGAPVTPLQLESAGGAPSATALRAAEMLTAYAEMVKATGKYAEMHYIPEIEYVIAELRGGEPTCLTGG